MGSGVSKSKIDDDDDFYNNCTNGNVEQVRQSLPTMTYKKINHQQKDGNTPLHTA
ncbi:unnamed protein product, partial [Adineta steineri]